MMVSSLGQTTIVPKVWKIGVLELMFIHILKNIIVVSTTSADDYFLSTDILLYM